MARKNMPRRVELPLALLLDVICVLTVVPLFAAAVFAMRSAWQVYHPRRRPKRRSPPEAGLPAERVTVAGADDVALACWFIPAPGSEADGGARDFVVLGHGLGRDSGMLLPLAKMLHKAGYHVLTFDMRNHGDSADDGLFRGQSPRYSVDHHHVVRYVLTRPEFTTGSGGGSRVACLGFSMSAWTSLEAARLEPEVVRAVICDSGPTLDIAGTLSRMFGATRGRLPRALRGPLMFRFSRAVFGRTAVFLLKPAPWPVELGDHTIRILFVSGEGDPVARPADIRRQLAWYPRAASWLVPRASHMQCHVMAAEEYGERVLGLLAEAFGRDPAGHDPAGHGAARAGRAETR